MSTPHLGEFFAALLGCAIERCERGDPASLRYEIGRLAYLTFGYSERDWLDQALFESDLNDETQGVLLAQLDRELSASSPAWLDRIQLRALILGVIRLVRAQWFTREELLREVCHIFSLSADQLATTDLSNVATLAPHLWIMLNSRAQLRRRSPKVSTEWAPIPKEYTALSVMVYQEDYWLLLVRRAGLTAYLELTRASDHIRAQELKTSLAENVGGWLEITRCGQEDEWVWAEHPAHLDLSLLTRMEQALTPEQAVLVCLPILRALSALHRTHRVCGALTPSSILIDSGCQAMLGSRLAWYPHIFESQIESLRTKDLTYWSPERFSDFALPTPQSDMWAFGLILYQLLCGDLPWRQQQKVPELIKYIKQFDHTEALKRVPESLRSFLARCLTPDLDHRWSHATQALEALSDVAELTSPLLKGQRLSEQWTVLMEVDGPQRFIEETAIIPTYEPEEDLARFVQVRIDLDDLASPHIDALTLKPLFPKLKSLHERWWSNHALMQETQNQQSSSLESFRLSLSNIAPEFLFEQLTLLSQQKESLELRFQDRVKRLVREREMIREEVRQHTKETLLSLWQELGLPEDLIPNLSLEAAANRGAKRTALASIPRAQANPNALLTPSSPELNSDDKNAPKEQANVQVQEVNKQEKLMQTESKRNLNKTAIEFAIAEEQVEQSKFMQELSEGESGLQGEDNSVDRIAKMTLSPQELSVAEAALREEIFSTPPMERLEKLSELGALKREIELSQPMLAISPPPPEWSQPPQWDAPPAVVSIAPQEEQNLADLIDIGAIEAGDQLQEPNNLQELNDLQELQNSQEAQNLQNSPNKELKLSDLPGPAELHHNANSQPIELDLSDSDVNAFDNIEEAEVDNLIDELELELANSISPDEKLDNAPIDEISMGTEMLDPVSSTWEPLIIDDFDEYEVLDEYEILDELTSQTLSDMLAPEQKDHQIADEDLNQVQVTPPPIPQQATQVMNDLQHELATNEIVTSETITSEIVTSETLHDEISSAITLLGAEPTTELTTEITVDTENISDLQQEAQSSEGTQTNAEAQSTEAQSEGDA